MEQETMSDPRTNPVRHRKKALEQLQCKICKTTFTPKHRRHKNCSPKCAYISDQLTRNLAHGMAREEAIAYYSEMYEDPLRSLARSRHKSLMRVIYAYCEENNKTTFTYRDLVSFGGTEFHPTTLAGIAGNIMAVSKTGARIPTGQGKSIIEWEFHKELLKPSR